MDPESTFPPAPRRRRRRHLLGLGLALSIIGVATSEKRQIGRSLAALEAFSAAPPEMTDKSSTGRSPSACSRRCSSASPCSVVGSPAKTTAPGSSTGWTSPATLSAGTSTACSA